jgi:hypothetical protein
VRDNRLPRVGHGDLARNPLCVVGTDVLLVVTVQILWVLPTPFDSHCEKGQALCPNDMSTGEAEVTEIAPFIEDAVRLIGSGLCRASGSFLVHFRSSGESDALDSPTHRRLGGFRE